MKQSFSFLLIDSRCARPFEEVDDILANLSSIGKLSQKKSVLFNCGNIECIVRRTNGNDEKIVLESERTLVLSL